ncbi:hypothetical protein K933_09447 [Candidatus Halobonum tyrrellensis G22]|uniref:Uncharacterized protein n=1 Tax=Candidatus Halobonum tyrrellensis G22 TaxID=1324957 RepID=V4IYZ3_9EURY|nr:hypothetical protein K933_09447 [Candidatus Halobonum tyrrellensis G22]
MASRRPDGSVGRAASSGTTAGSGLSAVVASGVAVVGGLYARYQSERWTQ